MLHENNQINENNYSKQAKREKPLSTNNPSTAVPENCIKHQWIQHKKHYAMSNDEQTKKVITNKPSYYWLKDLIPITKQRRVKKHTEKQ